MLRIPAKALLPVRILAVLMSLALFAYLICQAGPSKLWENGAKLGWGFTWVLALAGVSHVARAWAWRLTLDDHKHQISFLRLFGLRLGAEAAGQLGIVGQSFGDLIRVSRLSPEIPLAQGFASVTLDRGLYIAAGMIVLIAGLVGALPLLSHSHALRLYATIFVLALIFFLLVTVLALRKRWPVLSRTARLFARVPLLKQSIENRYVLIQSIENALLDFHHNCRGAFWCSFLLILASHCLAVMEVCLILWLIGVKLGLLSALVVEAMTKLVNVIGNINPGNFGTFEGGTMLISKMFGLSGAVGLTLGLARRLRALFWTAVGGTCLFILTRSRSRGSAKGCGMPDINEADTGEQDGRPFGITPQGEFAVAIFLSTNGTGDGKFRSGLARVGSLPVLLRNILAARKLGPSRIILVVDDPALRRCVQRELCSTGPLPQSVQWIGANADVSALQRLQFIATRAGSERLIIIDGNTVYHPTLFQKAKEWNSEAVGVMSSGDKHVGIYAFNTQVICDFQRHCTADAGTFQELFAPLTEGYSVTDVPVPEDLWQRVDSERDRQLAERKLDRWLVKPTDGIFARLNRKISIPISRQLIKFPVTANMVTILTLGVGFASGVFFARGGYWNTLLGAFLCLWASILDGCDGEVARLKLQESAFGCWLETVCDYLFYLILFVGMTLGLWRSSGSRMYLLCGAVLLFGAIASFLATGWQRHRLAAEHPEQLLKIWQTHAESRSSNPFLYFSRHTEFIIRRCFFPYALLFFALFAIMKVAFLLSVIGANLVWPMALYSSLNFAGARASGVADRGVSSEATPAMDII